MCWKYFMKISRLAETLLGRQSMICSLRRLFVQGGRGHCPSLNTKSIIHLSHLKKQQAFRCTPARANFLQANVHLREGTKQSWRENGCSCLFVVIWITEYASRGDKVCMRKLSMIFWSFPSTLRGFSSGSSSCADEKSNNPLDVIIPRSRANSSLQNSFSTESHLPPSSEERDLLSV